MLIDQQTANGGGFGGLLGNGFDDPRSAAIMALAGGLLKKDFGGGLLGANQAYAEANNGLLKRKYMQGQIDDMAQQQELRRQQAAQLARKQSIIEGVLGGGGAPAGVGSAPAVPGQFGGGMVGAMPSPSGMPAVPPRSPQAAPNGGGMMSRLTPDQLALLKLGADTDLTDIYKLTQPDMQVSNGYAYDKRNVQPGFLPGLHMSQDGKAALTLPGSNGLPIVTAPQGAMSTYAGYRGIDEKTKADFDPMTVQPQGENPQMTTRGALVSNPMVNRTVPPAVQATRDQEAFRIKQAELVKAQGQLNAALSSGDQSAAARAQADIAALQREMGGRRPSVGMPLQSDEEKLRGQEGVKADAKRNEALAGEAQKSKDTLANIAEARRLLKSGPTASGLGSIVDSGANFFGGSTKGADIASQLDTLSGWMVNNVPRMEGPQSNYDVQNYKTMAGLVGDRTKPISQRMAALDALEKLQQKYSSLNAGGNQINTGGATGDFGSTKEPAKALPQPMKGMVRNGFRFKGGDPSKQENWEKM